MVLRNVTPSCPSSPTVADAATTLWMAIMLPAAAPTACSATIIALETTSLSATPCWKSENMRLLTVFEPAMKAPSAPVTPANSGHTCPTLSATHAAMEIGMLTSPAAFTPELM